MRVLAVDWRCRLGQIDLIAQDGETLVIVEVKARRGVRFGLPQEAVDLRKQRKLRQLADVYRQQAARGADLVRIDVIGLLLNAQLSVVRCDHLRDAIQDQ
jgi:putative endonuclease